MSSGSTSFLSERSEGGVTSQINIGLARVIDYEDLKKATNNFEKELGKGGYGKVYLGKLEDGRMVAVKVLFDRNPNQLEQFFNEVTVLSLIRHKNLVTLYGCTNPRNHELLLVYEFVPNDTLANHLHGKRPSLSWAVRIQIAVETAEALTHLHAREQAIIHRDVTTSNILLDNDYHVKVADLGICRLVPWNTTHVSTRPQGTQGYRDPEYDLYFKLTDKTDVYSFGVVLMELISGQQAVDVNRAPDDIYLHKMSLNKISNKKLEEFVDPKLEYRSNDDVRKMINLVAELAGKCLEPKGDKRPPMVEVLANLKGIQKMQQKGRNDFDNIPFEPQVELSDGSLPVNTGSEGSLPADYTESLSRAISIEDLYFRLCRLEINCSLDRMTGCKCYTLSAGELGIVGGSNSEHWRWKHHDDSRFPEVAELLNVRWLDIKGRLECKLLTRGKNYASYLIFKLAPEAQGLRFPRQYASVSVRNNYSCYQVCLEPGSNSSVRSPQLRPDGWMEMELGEFFSGDEDEGEVEMRLWETESRHWKCGLIIKGIEVRPK